MADHEGDAPKKAVDLAKLVDDGSASKRLREQIDRLDPLADGRRAILDALAPSKAIQKAMNTHSAAETSALAGIASAIRVPKVQGIAGLVGPFRINAFSEIQGLSLAEQIASSDFSSSLEAVLEDVRASQRALQSVLNVYMDQQRGLAERISSIIGTFAIPRIDPATFRIASTLALSETNAFKIAGLTPDYTEQFRSVAGALGERLGAFAELKSTNRMFVLQPSLVDGISALLDGALAQQEILLEQQRQQIVQTQPRQQTLLAERIAIISGIATILSIMLFVYLALEERLAGGNAAILENTAAIEENTQALEQMRGSFGALADRLEQIHAIQEEIGQDEGADDAAIAEILREIADTLKEREDGQEGAPASPD